MDVMHVHPRPTALFCASDQLAMQVIRDLQAMGLRVPQDVSVAGFDGVQVGELMSPALTTVVQPSAEVGLCAFDLLQRVISGEQPRGSALLHHTLRLGGTVAPYSLSTPASPLEPALPRRSAAPHKSFSVAPQPPLKGKP
jgi:DNA-binding LacI/PurR family transcriptional regulator